MWVLFRRNKGNLKLKIKLYADEKENIKYYKHIISGFYYYSMLTYDL